MIYERLGTEKEILEKSNGEDISVWIQKYLDKLNAQKNELPVFNPGCRCNFYNGWLMFSLYL